MKKYLAVLLCVIMALGLVACGDSESVMVPSFDSNKVPAQRVAMRGGDGTIEATEATKTESKELSYEEAVDMLKEMCPVNVMSDVDLLDHSDSPVVAMFAVSLGRHSDDEMDALKKAMVKIPQCIKDDTYVGLLFDNYDAPITIIRTERFNSQQRREFVYRIKSDMHSHVGNGDSFYSIITGLVKLSSTEKMTKVQPMLFVITDGTVLGESKFEDILPAAEVIGVPVHIIVYDAKSDSPDELEKLEKVAATTGAQYIESNAESIDGDIQKLLRAVLY